MREQKEGVCVKKLKNVGILLLILILSGCATKQEEALEPDCINSYVSNGDYDLIIIANQKEITNKEAFAEQVVEKVRKNDFKTILFSYDLGGYPTSLDMTVYLNEAELEKSNAVMEISLKQEDWKDGYNIVENLDKFEMEIR